MRRFLENERDFVDAHIQLQNQDLGNWCDVRPSVVELFSGHVGDVFSHHLHGIFRKKGSFN